MPPDETLFVPALLGLITLGVAALIAYRWGVARTTRKLKSTQRLLDDASTMIQQNQSIFQRAMDNSRQGVLVLDGEFRVVARNKAFLDIYDIPESQVAIGTPLAKLCRYNATLGRYGPGDIDKQVSDRLRGYASHYRFIRQKLEPDGRTVEVRSSRLPDGGVVSTHTDISDLVIAEEERIRAQELLEQRVRERTEELTRLNEQLRVAKSEADAANQSKTRFLAAASHDILQPLNAARLFSASMVERDRRSGDGALAENISSSLDAVEEILTTLLDMSRLDSGALKPEFSTCSLGELTRILQTEFAPAAMAKELDLRFVHSSLSVRSDKRQLRRLIQNLISNAVKYTPTGKILVGVRRSGAIARVEVWDTGLGIPESKKQLIFEEFQRLDEGAKIAKGLGLGLSIVDRIARLLGHEISVDSTLGKGSVFRISMARSREGSGKGPAEKAAVNSGLNGLKVFVIDNEPAILEGMRALLSGWGCIVITAAGLSDSLTAFAADVPDIIIADYHLDHGEDGVQVIKALLERHPSGIPCALLTADRSPEMQSKAASVGALVLNKPLKPAALRALLTHIRAGRF